MREAAARTVGMVMGLGPVGQPGRFRPATRRSILYNPPSPVMNSVLLSGPPKWQLSVLPMAPLEDRLGDATGAASMLMKPSSLPVESLTKTFPRLQLACHTFPCTSTVRPSVAPSVPPAKTAQSESAPV